MIEYLLLGAFFGVCAYLVVDGYFALKERRRRFDEETDKYL